MLESVMEKKGIRIIRELVVPVDPEEDFGAPWYGEYGGYKVVDVRRHQGVRGRLPFGLGQYEGASYGMGGMSLAEAIRTAEQCADDALGTMTVRPVRPSLW